MRFAAIAMAGTLAGTSLAAPPGGDSPPVSPVIRCLLVAPLENSSDVPEAASVANGVLFSSAAASQGRSLGEEALRAVFAGSSLELPQGVPAGIAVDLAEILGADGVVYGAVEGSGRGPVPSLTVTLRLVQAGSRDLIRAASAKVAPAKGEIPAAALQRATRIAAAEVAAHVGGPPLPGCFDGSRLGRVRQLALAGAPAPAPPPPRPPPDPLTPRQADWSSRLAARERFVVEGVTFEGRKPRILRASGLEDLAVALRNAPALHVRIEGFVDSTGKPLDDLRLSLAMAQTAAERLSAMGIRSDRLTWAGRGGEAPLLPNFTARGRARNRRVEVVPLPETASRP